MGPGVAEPTTRLLQSPHRGRAAPTVDCDPPRAMNRMTIDRALTLAAHAAIVVFVVAWLIEHY